MMKKIIHKRISDAIALLQKDGTWPQCSVDTIAVERPKDVTHGDWTTQVAFLLAKPLKKAPYDIAQELAGAMTKGEEIAEIVAQKPGYINIVVSQQYRMRALAAILEQKEAYGKNTLLAGKRVMVEYTQPNPFKPFHIGHLMSNTIGESVSRIIAFCGAKTVRANYQGDVGPHVAKALWGLQKLGYAPDDVEKIGEAYAYGHKMSEEDETAKQEINAINAAVYNRDDATLMEAYEKGRTVTLAQFEKIYEMLGTHFDRYYFESQTWEKGVEIVRGHIGDIFTESDGAIVFEGEQYGLHTRVFITAQGLPTYETKEIGLAFLKNETCPCNTYVVTTAVEQAEYFAVVKKVLSLLDPMFEDALVHVPHGMMQLTTGKMSSRTGNVITGESLLHDAVEVARAKISERVAGAADNRRITDMVAVGGVKFDILKQRAGKNIAYDAHKALSFDGDSGPYIQYTYARCMSVMAKARACGLDGSFDLYDDESVVIARNLVRFGEVVEKACHEYAPHYIAQYVLELAHAYNTFYAHHVIVDEKQPSASQYRIALTQATAHVIKNSMNLLGIRVPEEM